MQLQLLRPERKFDFFSANKDFIEVVMVACSKQYPAQSSGSSLSFFPPVSLRPTWALSWGLWAVTTRRSTPVCSVIKIASSLSNKKREKDFACLGCTIIQSLRPDTSPHIICHFFFHFVNKHLGCNFSSRPFKKFQENRQNVSTEQKSLRIV